MYKKFVHTAVELRQASEITIINDAIPILLCNIVNYTVEKLVHTYSLHATKSKNIHVGLV